jgi:hypothetical protein
MSVLQATAKASLDSLPSEKFERLVAKLRKLEVRQLHT